MQILSPGALWGPSLPLSPWLALKSALYPDPGAEELLPPPPPPWCSAVSLPFSLCTQSCPGCLPPAFSGVLPGLDRLLKLQTRVSPCSPLWHSLVPARSPMVSAFLWGLCWLLLPLIFKSRSFQFSWCLSPPTLPPAAWPLLAPLVEFPFQRLYFLLPECPFDPCFSFFIFLKIPTCSLIP